MTSRSLGVAAAVAAVLALAACAPSTGADLDAGAPALPASVVDANFDLDALVTAAKAEGGVTVYDSTGDIVKMAEAFTTKYGIKATGVKADVGDTLDKMTREGQAGNVTIDLTLFEDGPSMVGRLLPQKTAYTWVPADLASTIPVQNPLLVLSKANLFVYNPTVFPNGCPVDNLWDLTSPEWAGKVALQDPLAKPNIVEWFNQMSATYDGDMRAAYKAETGKDLQSAQTAGQEWVKALAGNRPILTNSDDDVSAAVGAPNQTEQRIGLVSIAKFRDVADKGYKLAVCTSLKPYVGYQYPKYGAIATATKHPNAAKLFMRFAMTEEGIAKEMTNGGVSGNTAVAQSAKNPPGLTDWDAQLMSFKPETLMADFRNAEGMQDLWRLARG